MTRYGGGFGIAPLGQSETGHPKCDIEPRFYTSKPVDKQSNVATNTWLRFDTYCYSSWIDLENITVEISEDNGVTYTTAYNGSSFLPPYDGTNSKVRRPDSHTIRFWIDKAGLWPINETVKIKFTGIDEFGNSTSKEAPVIWS